MAAFHIATLDKKKTVTLWDLSKLDGEKFKTELKLDFLTPGKKYKAIIYEDAKDAHWEKNPKAYKIRTIQVTAKSKVKLNLAPGGGTAISFSPIN
jgi:uncharacterized protein YfaS (alpha-2-macroglobulin family)